MKTEFRLVILESPFAGDVEANLAYARKMKRWCVLRGMSPIASHTNLTQPGVLDDNDPEERALGIAAGLAWRRVADLTVFASGRGWSRGMRAALESAVAEGRPYIVVDGDLP